MHKPESLEHVLENDLKTINFLIKTFSVILVYFLKKDIKNIVRQEGMYTKVKKAGERHPGGAKPTVFLMLWVLFMIQRIHERKVMHNEYKRKI